MLTFRAKFSTGMAAAALEMEPCAGRLVFTGERATSEDLGVDDVAVGSTAVPLCGCSVVNDTFVVCDATDGITGSGRTAAVPLVAGAGTGDRSLSVDSAVDDGNNTDPAGTSAVSEGGAVAEDTTAVVSGVPKLPATGSPGLAAAAAAAAAASAALLSISSIRRCTIAGISCTYVPMSRWLERINLPAQLSTQRSWTRKQNQDKKTKSGHRVRGHGYFTRKWHFP